ncbi:O-glucosyltransferase rumi homolog [Macadamia integrifolia]|uniref:O-glucosyltransferase rumi homolog n=1 Tax=Macadamia integrifolia TaxID=60698 RepID=UPI001C4E8B54|nr:O-glucosyltransferase rumi homolog [Macadamia integrifolia]
MGDNDNKRWIGGFTVIPEAYKHFSETTWPLFKKGPVKTVLLFLLLFVAALAATRWTNTSIMDVSKLRSFLPSNYISKPFKQSRERLQFPFNCSDLNLTKGCSGIFPASSGTQQNKILSGSGEKCPHYFKWIHENLRPWKDKGGITREMVERGRRTANFRLLIVNGKVYVERYSPAFQTRDVFTWWGILQMMKRYPGKLPDLDLMFDCDDQPVIRSNDYKGLFASAPPPLFRYCADDSTMEIIFPDWSFWGWPEVNIKPWETLKEQLREGNKMVKWSKREPFAYWKGNPYTSPNRQELMRCNQNWNVRAYSQDWGKESREGFKNSDLSKQCTHRYKIYVEGRGWSVSEKYILACNSMTLIVKPRYYDFFSRSLMPLKHYWPIKGHQDLCRSAKSAVDWGNSHEKKAQDIGNEGSRFVQEELKMENVYDYMFHLLNEYAKLLKYKPTIPERAVEFCSEVMACPASGLVKQYMMESVVEGPSDTEPCTMPPPFDLSTLQAFNGEKENSTKQVETWEHQH